MGLSLSFLSFLPDLSFLSLSFFFFCGGGASSDTDSSTTTPNSACSHRASEQSRGSQTYYRTFSSLSLLALLLRPASATNQAHMQPDGVTTTASCGAGQRDRSPGRQRTYSAQAR
jgi:hypothetical protein